jgi:heme exporter protein A
MNQDPTNTSGSSRDYDGSALEAAGVTVVLGRVPVLRNVDLSVAQGESIAVMGPNGAGKTTLLKCLAGSLRPSRGELRWFGGVAGRSVVARRQIGFVGHEFGLYAELTALENLVFFGRMYGVEHARDRARALLAASGVETRASDQVGRLSRGLQQRVAIARALMHGPSLLVLDEPFANLDADGRGWLRGLYDKWRRERRTICFATHNVDQGRRLADRVVWLNGGRIAAVEPIAHLPLYVLQSA